MRRTTKISLALGAGAVAVAASGVAYAYWTAGVSSGTGAGATEATVQNVTIAGATVSDLAPGLTKNVTVTLSNPNDFSAYVGSKTVSVTGVSSTKDGCTAAVAQVSGSATQDFGQIEAKGSKDITVPVTMANDATTSQDACVNAPLTLTYSASTPVTTPVTTTP